MTKYTVVSTLKVRTAGGIKELSPGETVTLREDMAAPLLEAGRIKEILPYFDTDGSVVIPFGCDSRFHYWRGGQSIAETEGELRTWLH
ncbi:MAG: hypothetical protein Q8P48_08415 [Deltaproteobacteria bacterium]|nr:hypothetical protein [Deltaproteobacteria bacterium]